MKLIVKYRDVILLTIGTILVLLSLCLIFYDKVELIKENVFNEIELLKYRENVTETNNQVIDDTVKQEAEITDNLEELTVNNSEEKITKNETSKIEKEFIGYLEIEKINLRQGLVSKKSYYNNVNRNIQILSSSSYPDEDKGNVILAAHSGTSSISYFKNLYQLVLGDQAKIYYKNYIYEYKIVKIYNVPKTGTVQIIRDVDKNTLTLITCTKNSKTEQTVYILELVSKIKDGG